MVFSSTVLSRLRKRELIELPEQLAHRRHPRRIELVDRSGIHRNTDTAGLGVYTEWCLEQVVAVFGHLRVKSWVRVLEHDILLGGVQRLTKRRI